MIHFNGWEVFLCDILFDGLDDFLSFLTNESGWEQE
jgi:hypothetical protein